MVWVPQRRERSKAVRPGQSQKGQHTTIAMMLTRSRAHSCVCVTRVETGNQRIGQRGHRIQLYSLTGTRPRSRRRRVQPVAVSVTTDV